MSTQGSTADGPKGVMPVSDHQWAKISPFLLGGIAAAPDERPDLRGAVNALLYAEANDGHLPQYLDDPQLVQALHDRWRQNGTVKRILDRCAADAPSSHQALPEMQVAVSENPVVETPDTEGGNASETPTSSAPGSPGKNAQSSTGRPARGGRQSRRTRPRTAAGTVESKSETDRLVSERPERPNPQPMDRMPVSTRLSEPAAPEVTAQMVHDLEKWAEFHYIRARDPEDWTANDIGRYYLPHIQTVLSLLYVHWEAQSGQAWPDVQLLDPMPDEDWLNQFKHSRAMMIVTECLDNTMFDLKRAVHDVHEVAIRGTPYRHSDRTMRDRRVRIAANQTLQALENLEQRVRELYLLGVEGQRNAEIQEKF